MFRATVTTASSRDDVPGLPPASLN